METNNEIQIFSNPEFGQIRTLKLDNDQIGFVGKDVAEILGYKNPSNAIATHVDEEDKTIHSIRVSGSNYKTNIVVINESGIYALMFSSKMPKAYEFKRWVTSEVIPSIRKHGAYMTNDVIGKALADPDFLIQLASQLKEEQQKNALLTEDNNYKNSVIEWLTENISLADIRQRITQIIRKGGVKAIQTAYSILYEEFNKKYHVNVGARIKHAQYKGSNLDYIEKELHMLPELYELTCKLFESKYQSLIDSWGKAVQRAQGSRK